MFGKILNSFGFPDTPLTPIGNGLINSTFVFLHNDKKYILQKINDQVFLHPEYIDQNIKLISNYLNSKYPEYIFPKLINDKKGNSLLYIKNSGYYRVFSYIENTYVYKSVLKSKQAYEASCKFSEFTFLLKDFDPLQLKVTLDDFHNLSLRYNQFLHSVKNGNKVRVKEAKYLINFLKSNEAIVTKFETLKSNEEFRLRVTHHDTKISNILFNENDEAVSIIDLDTIMPGYFISDVGDMIRTYVSTSNEEEKDVRKIIVRDEYFRAIVSGYLKNMNQELTDIEKANFIYAGKFMIYMQSLRFLTDYLNNDIYYGCSYENHNLVRAENQANLLKKLIEKETDLQSIVESIHMAY